MYFIGDPHGLRPIFQIIDKHKLKNQNLIQVGDLGLGFMEITRDLKNLELLDQALEETGNTLFAIRGNHDNPIFWKKELGLWLPKYRNIHLVDDYQVRRIEDKNILFVGGAISIDRIVRRAEFPPTWWSGEEFNLDSFKLVEIENNIQNIDIVVTHTAPHFAYPRGSSVPIVNQYCNIDPMLRQDLNSERQQVTALAEVIIKKYKPKHWIYGHFHSSKSEKAMGVDFKLLNINELYEVN